jgi:hypothetical protein
MTVTRRRSVALLAGAAAMMAVGLPASAQQQQRPNIIMIVSDDTGLGDLGPMAAAKAAACRPRTSTSSRPRA